MADGIDSYFSSSDNDDGDVTTMTFLTQEQQHQQADDAVPNDCITSLAASKIRQTTETSSTTTSSALSSSLWSSLVHKKRRCSPRVAAAANTAADSQPKSRKRPAVAATVMSPTEQQRQTSPCRTSHGRGRPLSSFRETSVQAAAAAAATDSTEKEEEINRGEYDNNDDERKPSPSNDSRRSIAGENGTVLTKNEDTDESSSSTNSFGSDSFDDDESMSSFTNHVANNNTAGATNLTLTEKRARNVRRNNNVLASLGLTHGIIAQPTSKKQHSTSSNRCDTDVDENCKPRGMLLSGLHPCIRPDLHETSSPSSTLRLLEQYPHREAQIRKLRAWLSAVLAVKPVMDPAAAASNNHTAKNSGSSSSPFVPPPILITGPVGCGKTAVVQDVIRSFATHDNNSVRLEQEQATKLIHAYIDCATLDSTNIEELAGNAYTQLKEQMRRHKKKTSHVGAAAADERSLLVVTGTGSTWYPHPSTTLEHQLSPAQRQMNQRQQSAASSSNKKSRRATFSSADDGDTMVEHVDVSNRRMEPTRRRLSARNNDKRAAQEAAELKQVQLAKHDDIAEGQQQAYNTAPTAVWMFGRALERLLLSSASCTAVVLVVDHAERLLSLGSNSNTTSTTSGDRVNFLAQLLLLPRTLGLNVTIIVITKSVMLEHCTLNNMTSQGTIAGHINPIRLHFPAYRGKITIQSILLNKRMKRLIMGEGYDDKSESYEFLLAVYRSFLETLIQSLYDLTSDLKEYVRLGRALWPRYIAPISSQAATIKNLESIRKANVSKGTTLTSPGDAAFIQREILSLLDQKIFPQIRHTLTHGVGALAFESPPAVVVVTGGHASNSTRTKLKKPPLQNVPLLAKYLLLATYLCQANRPEKDKQLFSIQTNGKRKRRDNANNGNTLTGEEVAFGSSGPQGQQLKSLRRQAFPVERLYSLYVSLISLNPTDDLSLQFGDDGDDNSTGVNHQDEMLRSLGNVSFQETVAYLRDIGIIHDYPKRSVSENVRLSQRNFWSSMTRDEAQAVARSIDFPLDKYIL